VAGTSTSDARTAAAGVLSRCHRQKRGSRHGRLKAASRSAGRASVTVRQPSRARSIPSAPVKRHLVLVAATVGFIVPASGQADDKGSADASCKATPLTHRAPTAYLGNLSRNWVHVGKLWMGYTRADPAFVSDPTGQKIAWWREKGSAFGKLRVTGNRLDAGAPSLKVRIPSGYTNTWGFQSSVLYFTTPGCWQVVARVGLTQRYVFVIEVVPSANGTR
jgi:hypothetical protein